MNKQAKKYTLLSGGVLILGLFILFISTLVVKSEDVLAKNSNSGEVSLLHAWQGFSYNNSSAGIMFLFNIGLILSILGIVFFIATNLWLTKRMSKSQVSATFGKKLVMMYITLALLLIGMIISFIAGGSWDSMMDPNTYEKSSATSVHKFLAMAFFIAGLVMTIIHVSVVATTKDIKGKIIINVGKGV